MTHRTHTFRAGASLAAIALAGSAFLTACSGDDSGDGGKSTKAGTTKSGGTSQAPQQDPVAKATTMAAMYDYDGALAALAGQTSQEATKERSAVETAKTKATVYADNSQIPHLFYHSLVVDPKRAFHAKENKAQGYKDYMVTQSEFTKQLQQIYERGYVLVHPQRIAAIGADGKMAYQPITLPAGKKPLVLSIDDVSYYEYMKGDGFADKLVIDKDGKVRNTYADAAGTTHTGAYDVSTVVDDFVEKHPGFSYKGDKGSIALTGYNGVLGYRSSYAQYGHNATTDAERATATTVADAMKKAGWNFASHSYGHINFTKDAPSTIAADAKRWDADVKPIIGATKELIYPFGADISDVAPYSEKNPKFHLLHDVEGFDYFANVDGSTTAWQQLSGPSFRQGRINVDGISMGEALKGHSKVLSSFFDVKSTVDPERSK